MLEKNVLGLYKDLPLTSRLYLQIRVRNYPRLMWPHLSDLRGNIVSLGVGYAFLEALVALRNPEAQIIGSDLNAERIVIAQKALGSISNLSLEVVDLRKEFPAMSVDGFLLIDVLHHLRPENQEAILKKAVGALPPNGWIIIKECGTSPAWKKWFNYLNDAVGSPMQRTYPRGEDEWASLLRALGLKSVSVRLDSGAPYAHILISGRKS
jgi:trans-aconitate methyltransferase